MNVEIPVENYRRRDDLFRCLSGAGKGECEKKKMMNDDDNNAVFSYVINSANTPWLINKNG